MTVKFKIEIGEVEAFRQALTKMPEELRERLFEVMGDIARQTVQTARGYAPVRTGALRASIYAHVTRDLCWRFGAYVNYAVYQEYGTRYIAPRYFLTRAIQETMPLLVFAMQETIRQAWESAR